MAFFSVVGAGMLEPSTAELCLFTNYTVHTLHVVGAERVESEQAMVPNWLDQCTDSKVP